MDDGVGSSDSRLGCRITDEIAKNLPLRTGMAQEPLLPKPLAAFPPSSLSLRIAVAAI